MYLLRTIILLLLLSGMSGVAYATDDIHTWGKKVDQLFQAEGESDEQFQVRTFQRMRRFTRDSGYEASGHFCRSEEGQMGITIFTWEAHFSAPTMKGCPLALGGWPTVLDFVHTHPLPGRYTFSEQDVTSENRKRAFFKKSTKSAQWVGRHSISQFSSDDYDVGPGWLVADDLVLYQRGRGTTKVVMRLPALVD